MINEVSTGMWAPRSAVPMEKGGGDAKNHATAPLSQDLKGGEGSAAR